MSGAYRRSEPASARFVAPEPTPAPAPAPDPGPAGVPAPVQPADRVRDREIELLERRLAKVSHLLELRERELHRLVAAGEVDPGLASIYREVQGLDGDAPWVRRKHEMMSRIFEANLELQRKLGPDEHLRGPNGR